MSIFEYDEEKHKKMIYAEGLEDGVSKGEVMGEIKKLVTMTCKKLKKGKSPETIADELEEDLDTVKNICDIASEYAPDYDVEAICDRMLGK